MSFNVSDSSSPIVTPSPQGLGKVSETKKTAEQKSVSLAKKEGLSKEASLRNFLLGPLDKALPGEFGLLESEDGVAATGKQLMEKLREIAPEKAAKLDKFREESRSGLIKKILSEGGFDEVRSAEGITESELEELNATRDEVVELIQDLTLATLEAMGFDAGKFSASGTVDVLSDIDTVHLSPEELKHYVRDAAIKIAEHVHFDVFEAMPGYTFDTEFYPDHYASVFAGLDKVQTEGGKRGVARIEQNAVQYQKLFQCGGPKTKEWKKHEKAYLKRLGSQPELKKAFISIFSDVERTYKGINDGIDNQLKKLGRVLIKEKEELSSEGKDVSGIDEKLNEIRRYFQGKKPEKPIVFRHLRDRAKVNNKKRINSDLHASMDRCKTELKEVELSIKETGERVTEAGQLFKQSEALLESKKQELKELEEGQFQGMQGKGIKEGLKEHKAKVAVLKKEIASQKAEVEKYKGRLKDQQAEMDNLLYDRDQIYLEQQSLGLARTLFLDEGYLAQGSMDVTCYDKEKGQVAQRKIEVARQQSLHTRSNLTPLNELIKPLAPSSLKPKTKDKTVLQKELSHMLENDGMYHGHFHHKVEGGGDLTKAMFKTSKYSERSSQSSAILVQELDKKSSSDDELEGVKEKSRSFLEKTTEQEIVKRQKKINVTTALKPLSDALWESLGHKYEEAGLSEEASKKKLEGGVKKFLSVFTEKGKIGERKFDETVTRNERFRMACNEMEKLGLIDKLDVRDKQGFSKLHHDNPIVEQLVKSLCGFPIKELPLAKNILKKEMAGVTAGKQGLKTPEAIKAHNEGMKEFVIDVHVLCLTKGLVFAPLGGQGKFTSLSNTIAKARAAYD